MAALMAMSAVSSCTTSTAPLVTGGPVSTAVSTTAGTLDTGSTSNAPPTDTAPTDTAPTTQPATRTMSFTTPDGKRVARVHHPATAQPDAPLVVVLHPAATTALDMQRSFGWDTLADRDGFVVAYPDGLLDNFQNTWNADRCCPPASQLGTDDLGFLDDLVAALRRYDGVGDTVYAVGFSNGAMLAYRWACDRPEVLTGLGVVAGALTTDCPTPSALTVVAVHGDADPSVPIGGGPGPDDTTFPSLDASLAPFLAAAACPADPAETDDAVARTAVWTCADGHRVVREIVAGVEHAWPGAGPTSGTVGGPTDATGFLWEQLQASG